MRKRGMTVLELLVAASVFLSVAAMTTVMYRNGVRTMNHSSNRMDARQRMRHALERLQPILAGTFRPAWNAATGPLERPQAPYPADNPARTAPSYDPLSSQGPGNDSLLFYTPTDWAREAPLPAVASLQPHLYEVRLQAASSPDPTGRGRIRRDLVLQEMQLPASRGAPVSPLAGKPRRVLGRGLADFRVRNLANAGLQLHLAAQDVEWKSDNGQHRLFTVTTDTRLYFPVLNF